MAKKKSRPARAKKPVKKAVKKPAPRKPARVTPKVKPKVKETPVMSDKVKIEALEYYTHDGKEYQAGDTHAVAADIADSLVAQRKAKLVDEAKPAARKSQPVEPMTTHDFKKK